MAAGFVQEALTIAFLAANGVRLLAYLPQLAALRRAGCDAGGVSVLSWALFGVSNLTTALYAWAVLSDPAMALLFGVNLACCAAIAGLALRCRRRRRVQPPSPPKAPRRNRSNRSSAIAAAMASGRIGADPPPDHRRMSPLIPAPAGRSQA